MLARERGGRRVLCCGARSNGVGRVVAESSERTCDRRGQLLGDLDRLDMSANLGAEVAYCLVFVGRQCRESIELGVDRRLRHHLLKGIRRDAKAGRYTRAGDLREVAQM